MALSAVLWRISQGLAPLNELLVNGLVFSSEGHSIAKYLAAGVTPNAV